ncbi:MAG TPA: hypothetical protein VI381_03360, partial [Allosphingosinicella sp.]
MKKGNHGAMASPWRRRRPCLILAGGTHSAALLQISGQDALLETSAPLSLGAEVTLVHPEAGRIAACVDALTSQGVRIRFSLSSASVAFAL